MGLIKKIFVTVSILFVVALGIVVAIPFVFKEEIKTALEEEINASVNADISFDMDNFTLTVFKNFPNITAELKELMIRPHAPFDKNPLFTFEALNVEVNLKQLLFDDQLRVKGIVLVRPNIYLQVRKDKTANYNITYESSNAKKKSSPFSFGIDYWEIKNGSIFYYDESTDLQLIVKNFNHTGHGNFDSEQVDLTLKTIAENVSLTHRGIGYIKDKKLDVDMVFLVSENNTRYELKRNTLKLNEFSFSCQGWIKKIAEDKYDTDIQYHTQESTFKNLLSLVPGIYTEALKKIETSGKIHFNGSAKGEFSEKKIPLFTLNVGVSEGMISYPALPKEVKNITLDLQLANRDGVIENTSITLKKLHLDVGKNPIDIRWHIQNLKDYRMKGNIKAHIDLADVSKAIPMDGLEGRGNFSFDAQVEGVYDSIKRIIPMINMTTSMQGGYVKSSKFPLPLEDIQFDATIKNTSGKMEATIINMKNVFMMLDGEKISADIILKNMDNPSWNMNATGTVDLEKITGIFPLDDMRLKGRIKMDIHTRGKKSDVDKKHYHKLPTRGSVSLQEFELVSKNIPSTLTISQSQLTFDPKTITMKSMKGSIGNSDFNMTGFLSDYMGYVFGNEILKGKATIKSKYFDLNQFMSDKTENDEEDKKKKDEPYSVIPVPKNINFVLQSSFKKIVVMDYEMTNASGGLAIKNGMAILNNFNFYMLDGKFIGKGMYNPNTKKNPTYDMTFDIENADLKQVANAFSIIKKYAPIVGQAEGKFSSKLSIQGTLLPTMSPNLKTIDATATVKINKAGIAQSKIVSSVTALTNTTSIDNLILNDVFITAKIRKGRLKVEPFMVQFGGYKTTIEGSNGLDGSLDYFLKIDVPVNKLGSQVSNLFNRYVTDDNSLSEIPVMVKIGGTYKKPVLTLQADKQKKYLLDVAKKTTKKMLKKVIQSKETQKVINDLINPTKNNESNKKEDNEKKKSSEEKIIDGLQRLFRKKK